MFDRIKRIALFLVTAALVAPIGFSAVELVVTYKQEASAAPVETPSLTLDQVNKSGSLIVVVGKDLSFLVVAGQSGQTYLLTRNEAGTYDIAHTSPDGVVVNSKLIALCGTSV